jgi:excinuclease ABC subunit C
MKMCLAPCFKGCSDDEYRAEVARVQAYFDTSGESLVREISGQRDAASANLKFEDASALHARLDKLKPMLTQLPEIVHRIDRLGGVMVQRSTSPESVLATHEIAVDGIAGPRGPRIFSTGHAKYRT